MIGGDLACILEQVGCFEESVVRFYFAELVLAVESLHNLNFIHRDLKPGNILIDAQGHLKLTDFGLSEQGIKKLKRLATLCSSHDLLCSSRHRLSLKHQRTKELDVSIGEGLSPLARQIGNTPSPTHLKGGLDSFRGGFDSVIIRSDSKISSKANESFSNKVESLESFEANNRSIVKNKKDEEVIFTFLEEGGFTSGGTFSRLSLKNEKATPLRKKEIYRIVGTPDYMAPEIVSGGKGANEKSVDLWSLGCILYELLVGITPFNDETVEKVFDNITNLKMSWPDIGYGEDCMTTEACDLIQSLLKLEPEERLTIKEIKSHPFFEGLLH